MGHMRVCGFMAVFCMCACVDGCVCCSYVCVYSICIYMYAYYAVFDMRIVCLRWRESENEREGTVDGSGGKRCGRSAAVDAIIF